MNKFYFAGLAVIIINLLLAAIFIPDSRAQNSNSQDYSPSRYVIIAAPVNVISPSVSSNHRIKNVMVKMDTVTGRAWILQMRISGGAEANLRESEWHEVGLLKHRRRENI